MNEDILRAMIRQSIERRLGAQAPHDVPRPGVMERPLPFSAHVSHFRYTLPETPGPCYIEPGVHCSHCGYCQSHGH